MTLRSEVLPQGGNTHADREKVNRESCGCAERKVGVWVECG